MNVFLTRDGLYEHDELSLEQSKEFSHSLATYRGKRPSLNQWTRYCSVERN